MRESGPLYRVSELFRRAHVSRLTRRSVKVSQIQGMRVVRLPRREEHGQNRNKGGKGTNLGRAVSNSRSLQEACQCAVQRINAVAMCHSQ